MKQSIIKTADGSHSVLHSDIGELYHSKHGAIQESLHVFLEAGYGELSGEGAVHILEFGFGTGLNAFLTALQAIEEKRLVYYTALEKFPLEKSVTEVLNYPESMPNTTHAKAYFSRLHEVNWGNFADIHPFFQLRKVQIDFEEYKDSDQSFDLIYFDAFAPEAQAELWSQNMMNRCSRLLKPDGIWVSYCAKGVVRRRLLEAGLSVEKIPGPPGKREMLRARK